MDIPDLVRRKLGDEEIQAGVSLGDEDAACLTPTRTLVYRGEGLLSDEQVDEYSHDVERVVVSEGRRKTKFTIQYIDGTESFSVPANRGEKVLELFMEGVLRLDDVIDRRESVVGVYRFSELTVIITEGRLIKHIGEHVWDEDFEVYPYEDVTSLDFERASVATSISLAVDGRPQRIKVPNDQAPVVRQTLEKTLFGYYDVDSLDALNRAAGETSPDSAAAVEGGNASDDGGDFEFGDDFDPLVSDDGDDEDLTESVDTDDALADDAPGIQTETQTGTVGGASDGDSAASGEPAGGTPDSGPADGEGRGAETASFEPAGTDDDAPATTDASATETASTREATGSANDDGANAERVEAASTTETDTAATTDSSDAAPGGSGAASSTGSATDSASEPAAPSGRAENRTQPPAADPSSGAAADPISREEFDAVVDRLDDLTEAVERQNELLRRQHRAIKQLVKQRSDED